MPNKKRASTKVVRVVGPTVIIDEKEVLNFNSEFTASITIAEVDSAENRASALHLHQEFVKKIMATIEANPKEKQ